MPTDTRQRLTEAATARFYRDGFRNVGLDQVIADVGISKTAFYKHFQSKDDLMLAVLEQKNLWLQQTFRDMIQAQGGTTAAGQLRSLFNVVEQIINSEEFHGCIFVNASMEFPLPHDPAHEAAAQHKHAIEAIVAELAARAGAANPSALASELCLIMEGAYVTHQVTGDRQAASIARRIADLVLSAHLPHSPA